MRLAAPTSALALLVSAAAAEEPPSRGTLAPPPPMTASAPLAVNWSGFYFGGHGGWGFGSGQYSDGGMAGGQVGVSWQYGRFVVGFEGEASWVDWGGASVMETALARGGVAFGRLLAYGSGGIAARDGVDLVGWVAGAGIEYAFAEHWSAGVEYLHYDFADDDAEVVRGRVSYHVGGRPAGDFSHGGIFDEVRVGVLGFWQDNAGSEEGVYVAGQVLFDPLLDPFNNWLLNVLLRPRPHVGGSFSPSGTDQLFAGLTWNVPLGRMFFAEASFGGTVHNGAIIGSEVSLGCHALFRESAGIGANIGEHWRIVASVDHSSHAELCSEENDGLTHVGVSVGYRF